MRERSPHDDFASEADLVRAFCECIERLNRAAVDNPRWEHDWSIYAETGGFDLLLSCRRTQIQIGVEAKLSLNLKVIEQALGGPSDVWSPGGPDYRAILVPNCPSVQKGIRTIANLIGLTVLMVYDQRLSWHGTHDPEWRIQPGLPDEDGDHSLYLDRWHAWLPLERIKLPDYVPDVTAGIKSPVALTAWKIKAIKLMILLERNGRVTRGDMKALQISSTRWTDAYNGFLVPDAGVGGYVRCALTPDFRALHPRNYVEIEADFEKWAPLCYRRDVAA